MTQRLRADFWVAALLRRCNSEGTPAMLRRRGVAEAGAIFVVIDNLAGGLVLYGAAPPSEMAESSGERQFIRLHKEPLIDSAGIEQRLARQLSFDPDIWIVEIEDRQGRSFFEVLAE